MTSIFDPKMTPYCLACKKSGHTTTQCHSTHGMNTPADHELFRLCEAAHQWERHVGPKDDPRVPEKRKGSEPPVSPVVVDLAKASQARGRPEGAGHHGFPHAGKFQPVVDQIIRMIREKASHSESFDRPDEPEAIRAWRQARAELIEATQAYNAAVEKAAEVDAIKGFGYTDVNPEFQAMSAASRQAHQLMPAALDALYAWRATPVEPVGAQCRFTGQDWAPCSVEHHHLVQATPQDWQGYETRLIYAAVGAAAPGNRQNQGHELAPAAGAGPSGPVTPWEDPRVQRVYELLCSDEAPPEEQHWEGWVARRIVDALDAEAKVGPETEAGRP